MYPKDFRSCFPAPIATTVAIHAFPIKSEARKFWLTSSAVNLRPAEGPLNLSIPRCARARFSRHPKHQECPYAVRGPSMALNSIKSFESLWL